MRWTPTLQKKKAAFEHGTSSVIKGIPNTIKWAQVTGWHDDSRHTQSSIFERQNKNVTLLFCLPTSCEGTYFFWKLSKSFQFIDLLCRRNSENKFIASPQNYIPINSPSHIMLWQPLHSENALKGHFYPTTWKAPSNTSKLIIIFGGEKSVGTRHCSC